MKYLLTLQAGLKILEAIAAITGFIYFKKIRKTPWQWFPVFLLLIVLSELLGHYLVATGNKIYNRNLYHYLVIPGEFIFYFWLFYKYHLSKKLFISCITLYLLAWGFDTWILNQDAYKVPYWFSSLSYSVGNLVLVILILKYFLQLVNSNSILFFKSSNLFWVSTGLLVFFLGTFPYFGLRNLLHKNYTQTFWTYTYIMFYLNYFMYIMFSISFIWGKPNSKSF
jgi:hypothetical protein